MTQTPDPRADAARDRDQAIAKALGTFVRDARDTGEESIEGPERGE